MEAFNNSRQQLQSFLGEDNTAPTVSVSVDMFKRMMETLQAVSVLTSDTANLAANTAKDMEEIKNYVKSGPERNQETDTDQKKEDLHLIKVLLKF